MMKIIQPNVHLTFHTIQNAIKRLRLIFSSIYCTFNTSNRPKCTLNKSMKNEYSFDRKLFFGTTYAIILLNICETNIENYWLDIDSNFFFILSFRIHKS